MTCRSHSGRRHSRTNACLELVDAMPNDCRCTVFDGLLIRAKPMRLKRSRSWNLHKLQKGIRQALRSPLFG